MNVFFTVLMFVVGIWPLAFSATPAEEQKERTDSVLPPLVSMIELIARPERWEGKRIRVIGVLDVDGIDYRLYLTSEHRQASDMSNSVIIGRSKENAKYLSGKERYAGVLVELCGTFVNNQGRRYIYPVLYLEARRIKDMNREDR
jgi:hypothetical protein